MASNQSEAASGSVGFGGALFLLFLGLKLTHYIDWSWWWVAAPLWIPVVLTAAVFAVVGLCVLVAAGVGRILGR